MSTVTFDASPSSVALAVATLGGLVGAVAAAVDPLVASIAVCAGAALPLAVYYRSHSALAFAAGTLFVAVLLAGLVGASPPRVLLGVGAAVVAWDAGSNGLTVGAQLGADATTRSVELVHVAGTVCVALVVAVASFLVFDAVGTLAPTALVLLIVAAVILAWLLER
ncbi:DUF7519 family protein [Natronobiforma cellulositropha]|uniref:DUF7519 family protein n=1 Tax=Natronobiforma cellulositropha TaxID=1679076 RepID=UPI0021D60C54|nr:hypothetical protein [Natronobiforma cellulositropha]